MVLKKQKKTLDDLVDIENVDVILSEEEVKLLNRVFSELKGFDQITDDLEKAISNNRINHSQLNQILKIITKTVYLKIYLKESDQPRKGFIHTFFELPEILSKKIYLYIYRNRFIMK